MSQLLKHFRCLRPGPYSVVKSFARIASIAVLLTSSLSFAQSTTLFEQDFSTGLGEFSASGRVSTGSYGVRLRGGVSVSEISSGAIDISNASNLSLSVNRATSGLDAGDVASVSYSFDGSNFVTLESLRSASGQVRFSLPGNQSRLYLRLSLQASSYFESYTVSHVVLEGTTGNDPTDPDPPPPSACEGGSLQAGLTTRSVSVGGTRREYILSVPRSYNGQTAVPLLLDFHPLLSDAEYQRDNSGMRSLSEQENFIVAFPQGVDGAWNFGPCCTESRQVDDLQFARNIVADVSANACVDRKRVYASGYSNGGGMSYHLACNAADMIAAVAPAAFDLVEEVSCNPVRPISVYASRGRLDFIVPYRGGESNPPTPYRLDPIHFLGAQGTFNEWGNINNCPTAPVSIGNSCEAYRNCGGGTEVVLCTEFGGHSGWNAGEAWNFLKTQQLP